jgi:hypothetical protein
LRNPVILRVAFGTLHTDLKLAELYSLAEAQHSQGRSAAR